MNNQKNAITNKDYEGKNQANLTCMAESNGYKSNSWITFLQARELKLKIKKGSKGISIFKGFTQFTEFDKNKKIKTNSKPLGFARVFNLDQTEKANY